MSRFFAFGCSYTDYNWATWADGLCVHYNQLGWETYNYGNSGMGNAHILNALCAADLKHQFTDSDVICVLWSSWAREDRLWHHQSVGDKPMFSKIGSIVHTDIYPYRDYFTNWFCFEDHILKNITAIHTANSAFKINYQAHISHNEEYRDDEYLDQDPIMHEFVTFAPQNNFYDRDDQEYMLARKRYNAECPELQSRDGHPPPGSHLQFLKYKVCPALGITLCEHAEKWMMKQHNKVRLEDQKINPGDNDHSYRQRLQELKFATLPFMKRWTDLWGEGTKTDSGEDAHKPVSPVPGIVKMFQSAKSKGSLH